MARDDAQDLALRRPHPQFSERHPAPVRAELELPDAGDAHLVGADRFVQPTKRATRRTPKWQLTARARGSKPGISLALRWVRRGRRPTRSASAPPPSGVTSRTPWKRTPTAPTRCRMTSRAWF